jgi:hypothetical protein
MAQTNVGWGAPRIHGELRKLGIRVSEATVSHHMPKRPVPPGSGQRWSAFLDNHLSETLAIDFAVVPTITFGLMFDRRRFLHFNVTKHPTASRTAHQVVQACDSETPGRYLLRDNDSIWPGIPSTDRAIGSRANPNGSEVAVAERVRRAMGREPATGLPRPRDRHQRAAVTSRDPRIRRVLPRRPDAPRVGQGHT